jgi:hypothetical protein
MSVPSPPEPKHVLWRRMAELTLLAYVRFGWVLVFILR